MPYLTHGVIPVTRKLFIKTYGCQMNVYDSARMADVLAPLGYVSSSGPDGADMVILNTCHIRERASEKVYSELGRLRKIKKARTGSNNKMVIAVAGCVAQAEGEEILRRAPYVDIVLGPQTYHRLPEMVALATRASDKRNGNGNGLEDFTKKLSSPRTQIGTLSWINPLAGVRRKPPRSEPTSN